ncbi:MAG TPA: alanine racemase [Polyangiaceae bacterium]|nr:alanine racemase [Polyangiaceae bacterium]
MTEEGKTMAMASTPPDLDSLRDRPSSPEIRVLRPRRAAPADAVRPTRAEVNLAALRHNLRVVQRHARQARVWPVLKADAYGHGAPAVARTLERAGADGFCVALLEEAIELREAGITSPILVMSGSYGGGHDEVVQRGLVPVVYDRGQLEELARAVRQLGATAPYAVHLKIDTGMARLGVPLTELASFAQSLHEFPELRVAGLMTHLACADAASTDETAHQLRLFDEATATLGRHGVRADVRHAANSAALLRGESSLDAVRPGIAIFGVSPVAEGASEPLSAELRQAIRVRTEIVSIRELEAGKPVGYGALHRTTRPSRIATVPMGYADGLSRKLTNRGHMLVRGARAPIVGAVSMDMTMLDVTDVPGATLRDEVIATGAQDGPCGRDHIGAQELAAHADTIPWEILTSISRRVPRFYREP